MQTQLRKGVLEMCILALLKQQDSYAYDMVQTLGKYLPISEGTIYPLMRRLQNQQWVDTYLQESSGGPARKFYSLTDLGKTELQSMQSQWQDFANSVNHFLNKASSHTGDPS
ncbi:PadR family transcriptional regulator [Pasteurellaceae bacterium USgator11]|nr:PadR family transcriptional regulator [Pasteurellaceae bacterium USgator41]TNG97116.1 PadR family transcriptional regulator [Pasteurellaceae bacterium UScroc12]TNG98152.1 PadR family transcriptional regulator [Pasteurellaceae bacterium UScroc31]TNH00413.1 PadR family transcriptional regulator [Pasteurellaceae bacterium USgator11]